MARWPCLFPESFSMAVPKDLACFKRDLPRSFSMLGNIQSMLHRRHFNPLKTLGSRSYYFSILESGGGGLEESHSFPVMAGCSNVYWDEPGWLSHWKLSIRPVDLFLCWRPVFLGWELVLMNPCSIPTASADTDFQWTVTESMNCIKNSNWS